MERTDAQELEQRENLRNVLTEQIHGLQNDYVILAVNHGTNVHAALLMVDIKKKIEACENLLRFYKK
jgi:hypothetical protein